MASYGERVVGLLIDVVIILVLAGIPLWLSSLNNAVWLGFLGVLIYFGGYGWFQWLNGVTGQSPGKAVMGLRVVGMTTGQPIGGVNGLLRWGVAWVLNICCIGALLDYLWPLWDEKRQTLHDKAVNSVVLTGQTKRSGMDIFTK